MTSLDRKDAQPAKTQVKVVESPVVPPLSLPPYTDPGSTSHHHNYHSLGHCLRTNIFPGVLLTWTSLTRESYIRHPLTNWSTNPHLWYGHKTDEVVQWMEQNIMNQKLKKLQTEMEQKGTTK